MIEWWDVVIDRWSVEGENKVFFWGKYLCRVKFILKDCSEFFFLIDLESFVNFHLIYCIFVKILKLDFPLIVGVNFKMKLTKKSFSHILITNVNFHMNTPIKLPIVTTFQTSTPKNFADKKKFLVNKKKVIFLKILMTEGWRHFQMKIPS